MQEIDVGSLIFGIVLTWTVGLIPPIVIRFAILKRPMGKGSAIGTVLAFWLFNLMFFIALGSKSRSHIALVLVALVSMWILRRPMNEREAKISAAKARESSSDGSTELMTFASIGNLKAMEAQLNSGTGVNAADSRGWTALMYAASRDELDAVRLLLAKGANANAKNNAGQTARDLANEKGCVEVLGLLESEHREKRDA